MTSSAPHAPHRLSPPAKAAALCTRHPRTVVVIAGLILAMALASLSRLRISASLEAMLGSQSAAAEAFGQVMHDFGTGESLLAIIEPADPAQLATPESQAATAAFADSFVLALQTDPRTKDRIAWARARQDPQASLFAATRIFPNGPYFLGERGTRELLTRFDPAWLSDQFKRNESLMASPGPAGDVLSRSVLKDPLRLFELAAAAGHGTFDPAAANAPSTAAAPEFSHDGDGGGGRAILVRIASNTSLNDLEQSTQFVHLVRTIGAELCARSGQTMSIRLGGAYAIAAVAAGTIRADSIFSTLLSIGLLYALFVLFYRRWVTPLLIGIVAAVGLIIGFGVHALGGPTISPLAAAVAALLAGLGVDYGIHFVAHFDALRARGLPSAQCACETAREMALPITTNCFTSIFGFASLWPSKIQMLSDFAKLGTAGLIGAWVAAFTLLPALLVLTHAHADHTTPRPPRFGFIADAAARKPRFWLSAVITLITLTGIAAGLRGQPPRLEGNLTVLHPQPNEALDTTDETIRRFAGNGEVIPILIKVDQPDQLLPAAIDAAAALRSAACRSIGVVDVLGLHRLLPDPRQVAPVEQLLTSVDSKSLLANFDAALNASVFDPAAYTGYRSFLARMLASRTPPTYADLAAFPSLAQRLLPLDSAGKPATRTLLIARLDSPLRDRDRRALVISTLRTALANSPQATLAGLPAVSAELEEATRDGLPQSILISVTLVLIWLSLVFRRVSDVLLALVPLIGAGLFTLFFMMATNIAFNPINSIAIPLLDGIAVDAGVFLVSVARLSRQEDASVQGLIERLRPTMHAVLLASATTITGFASLCVMHTPAVVSLGFVAAMGIAASFAAAAGILVPLLLMQSRRMHAAPAD
ncbi:MAG: MMPL family transporter [Planctomycetota bacterium]|nr:MMPL family transporter [Planctomycetota bacterium]